MKTVTIATIIGLISALFNLGLEIYHKDYLNMGGWIVAVLYIILVLLQQKGLDLKQDVIDAQNDLIELYKTK